jgi:hypothetical protein
LLHNWRKRDHVAGQRVKLEDNWPGPYRIRETSEAGYYWLEELFSPVFTRPEREETPADPDEVAAEVEEDNDED